ncbi:hypothetical protein A1QO_05485 [Vibrio genomosp. F10 str. ZF-129]|uniref:Type II secretion system protein GspF domain-containing protein n=1 Tax=Vibrio genomosp. F10 str. ZF-129 TaxID=1187848 RepID=A0A1E5BHS0_9VIBR|nr:hypothetical protein [Vibrio genomosp. F10]OEE35721.1 hypothetical protein A1QO_05485 [Vibrio genomosp. F10 str. ZF-129]
MKKISHSLFNFINDFRNSSRLKRKQQLAILKEWRLLADIQTLPDICRTKKEGQTDPNIESFWIEFESQVRRVEDFKVLSKYFDERIADILISAIGKSAITDALDICIESFDKSSGNVTRDIHMRMIKVVIYLLFAGSVCIVHLSSFENVLETLEIYELQAASQMGYYISRFVVQYGLYFVGVYIAFIAVIEISFKLWVSEERTMLSHSNYLYKIYRYKSIGFIVNQISLYRKTGVVLHDILPKLTTTSCNYTSSLLSKASKLSKKGITPYEALCQVSLFDAEETKLIRDTLSNSNDKEHLCLNALISTYEYKYDTAIQKTSRIYSTVCWVMTGVIFVIPFIGERFAQFSLAASQF